MRKEDTRPLDARALRERLDALDLKQWWLADRIGVDRKTVGRWLSGRVKRIARDNLARLAAELGCGEAELLAEEDAVFATREEQRAAADAVKERDLLQLLAPTDDWRLAESLIKATLQPHLPLRSLGQLRNLLSVAAWRQGRYPEGLAHAQCAREIGERLDDRGLVLKAILNAATIHSFVGPIPLALEEFTTCLAEPEGFDGRRDHAVALSNVAWLHRSALDFEAAFAAQRESVAIFESLGLDLNLAISWISLTLYFTELARFDEALEALARAREHAERSRYERGLIGCAFYEADIEGLRGERTRSLALVRQALPEIERFEAFDLTCREIAARQFRLSGELEEAERQLSTALSTARDLPLIRAALLVEGSRLAAARGEPSLERGRREEANEIHRAAGLEQRVRDRPHGEHGA